MSGFAVGGAAVGTLSDKLRIVTTVASFEFAGEDAIVSAVCIATPSSFEFGGEDAEVRFIYQTTPPSFIFAGEDADSSAEGAVSVTSSPPIFVFVGEDGVSSYIIDTEKEADLVATRVGNDITLNVRNAEDDEGIILYKAASGNENFTILTFLKGSSLPYVDTVAADARPKYKAAFGVQGTIGGTSVTKAGRRSPSKYSR